MKTLSLRSTSRQFIILLTYALTAFFVLHIFMLNNGWFRELNDLEFQF